MPDGAVSTAATILPEVPLLEVRDAGRKSASGEWLIRHISLSICAGQRWTVTGRSGSGKTLLLRMMCLLDAADEGCVNWQGRSVRGQSVPVFRRQVIYLHQQAVVQSGTVEDNLRRPFAYRHAPSGLTYSRELSAAILDQIGWPDDFLDRETGHLSGGERQVLAVLRAILLRPQILLLDEPTTALDEQTARAVEELVSSWFRESARRSLVWVTHDPAVRQRVADREFAMPGPSASGR